jgi:hypothetical protein
MYGDFRLIRINNDKQFSTHFIWIRIRYTAKVSDYDRSTNNV